MDLQELYKQYGEASIQAEIWTGTMNKIKKDIQVELNKPKEK